MADTEYFSAERPAGAGGDAGAYVDYDALSPISFAPGLDFRPVLGREVLVNFVSYEPHSEAPVHAHEEEQITFVVDGEFEFDLDGDVRLMRRGMAVVVPPWVPHGARTLEAACFEVDVFHPPRKVLLRAMDEGAGGGEGGGPAGES